MTGKQVGTLLGACLAIGIAILIIATIYAVSTSGPEDKSNDKDLKKPTVVSPH